MPITEQGRDIWAYALSNTNNGYTAAATSVSTTTVNFAAITGASFVGQDIYVNSSPPVVGTIVEGTGSGGAGTVVVARWETIGKRETSGSTPTGTPTCIIASGASAAQWMALWETKEQTIKTSEWETKGKEIKESGIERKLAEFSHTTPGTNKYTLKAKFELSATKTFNIGAIGVFNCANPAASNKGTKGQKALFWTELSSTATLTTNGDSIEITDNVEGS